MSKYLIRQITSRDTKLFPEVIELFNRTQGRDLCAPDYLDKLTSDSLAKVFGAFQDNVLIGAGVAKIISAFDYYLPFDPNIVSELSGKTVGSFSILAVTESLQGKGIGQLISIERLKWLKEKQCEVIVGVSWVSGKAHTSNRVFEKMGFRPVRRVADFFVNQSKDHPFICPTCGEPPCTCPAIMYRMDLNH